MYRWRRAACTLPVVAILICACATFSRRSADKRFSEDLQKDGFLIVWYEDGQTIAETTVAAADVTSTGRLMQWFHQRPKAPGDLDSLILQGFDETMTNSLQAHFHSTPQFRIETTRFRVNFRLFMVVMETRPSTADAWTQISWPMRKEDAELRDWAVARVTTKYVESMLERTVLDGDSEMPDAERAGMPRPDEE